MGAYGLFPRDFILRKVEALEYTALLSLPAAVLRLLEFTDVLIIHSLRSRLPLVPSVCLEQRCCGQWV